MRRVIVLLNQYDDNDDDDDNNRIDIAPWRREDTEALDHWIKPYVYVCSVIIAEWLMND